MKKQHFLFLVLFFAGLKCNSEQIGEQGCKKVERLNVVVVSLKDNFACFELPYIFSCSDSEKNEFQLSEEEKDRFLEKISKIEKKCGNKEFRPISERRRILIDENFREEVCKDSIYDENQLLKYYMALYKLICTKYKNTEELKFLIANSKMSFVPSRVRDVICPTSLMRELDN